MEWNELILLLSFHPQGDYLHCSQTHFRHSITAIHHCNLADMRLCCSDAARSQDGEKRIKMELQACGGGRHATRTVVVVHTYLECTAEERSETSFIPIVWRSK